MPRNNPQDLLCHPFSISCHLPSPHIPHIYFGRLFGSKSLWTIFYIPRGCGRCSGVWTTWSLRSCRRGGYLSSWVLGPLWVEGVVLSVGGQLITHVGAWRSSGSELRLSVGPQPSTGQHSHSALLIKSRGPHSKSPCFGNVAFLRVSADCCCVGSPYHVGC